MSISSEINRIRSEVGTQADLIEQIKIALEGKVAGGGSTPILQDKTFTENGTYTADSGYDGLGTVTINVPEPILQEKSVTPTKSEQTVAPDSGYDGLSKVTVGAIPSDYIIPSGTKSITANGTVDVKSYANVSVSVPIPEYESQTKTITPTKSTQNVTPDSGYDGLSKVTINPIPNEYIVPSGTKSITENGTHDVTANASVSVSVPIPDGYIQPSGSLEITENGTYDVTQKASVTVNVPTGEGDSNEEIEAFAGLFENTTTNFTSELITKVSQYAFAYRTSLKSISLPNLKSSNTRVFANCDSLTSLSIPNMTGYTYQYMAAYCGALQTADVKQASYVSSYSFYGCANLTKLEFNRVGTIATNAFNGCTKLATLILRSGSLVTLGGTSAFTGTKIAGSGGYIYVPRTLADGSDGVNTYKAATNWSTYASKFRAIEDYPDICG